MRHLPISMFRGITVIALSLSSLSTLYSAETWPKDVVRYESEPTKEKLETMEMDRMLLTGMRNIQMDLLEGMKQGDPDDRYSVAFTSPYNPRVKFGLSVFKASAFSPVLDHNTMMRYLSNLSKQATKDKDELFEVTMEPEPDGGRTVFRFLNTKPFTVQYTYTEEFEETPVKMIRQESWALMDGYYYVITIEAPEKNFDAFLTTVKQPAGSMHFIDS